MKKLLFALSILIASQGYSQRLITFPTIDSTYTIPVNKGKTIRRIYALDLKGAGLTNPMTTTGDMIYSASGSTPSRLPIGTSGQVLTVVSGVPSWATVSASGTVDATPTSGSTNPVQSGGVFTALAGKASTSSPTITNATLSGFPSIALLKITGRVARADASYTLSSVDYIVAFTSLTATRSVTLPAASSCPNTHFIIKDESGNAGSFAITIVGTVDGAVNPTAINTAYGKYRLYSSGSAWFTE